MGILQQNIESGGMAPQDAPIKNGQDKSLERGGSSGRTDFDVKMRSQSADGATKTLGPDPGQHGQQNQAHHLEPADHRRPKKRPYPLHTYPPEQIIKILAVENRVKAASLVSSVCSQVALVRFSHYQ
jgi:hypothetical protein